MGRPCTPTRGAESGPSLQSKHREQPPEEADVWFGFTGAWIRRKSNPPIKNGDYRRSMFTLVGIEAVRKTAENCSIVSLSQTTYPESLQEIVQHPRCNITC